jgi:hypothetical protein
MQNKDLVNLFSLKKSHNINLRLSILFMFHVLLQCFDTVNLASVFKFSGHLRVQITSP